MHPPKALFCLLLSGFRQKIWFISRINKQLALVPTSPNIYILLNWLFHVCVLRQTTKSPTNKQPRPLSVSLTLTVPSYAVPIPLWGSIPSGPFVWSCGTGHTAGALSAHVTWQEKLHTGRRHGRRRYEDRWEVWDENIWTGIINDKSYVGFECFYLTLFIFLPSQVQPWRMSPTMSEVHWLHLVGVLNPTAITPPRFFLQMQ